MIGNTVNRHGAPVAALGRAAVATRDLVRSVRLNHMKPPKDENMKITFHSFCITVMTADSTHARAKRFETYTDMVKCLAKMNYTMDTHDTAGFSVSVRIDDVEFLFNVLVDLMSTWVFRTLICKLRPDSESDKKGAAVRGSPSRNRRAVEKILSDERIYVEWVNRAPIVNSVRSIYAKFKTLSELDLHKILYSVYSTRQDQDKILSSIFFGGEDSGPT